ncbi:MAG: cardiolipin synthase [Alkalispirochaetaceae bacterium]
MEEQLGFAFPFFSVVNVILIGIIVFFERSDPHKTLSWVLVLVFLPVIGVAGYLFFSGRLYFRERRLVTAKRRMDQYVRSRLMTRFPRLASSRTAMGDEALHPYEPIVRMNLRYGQSFYSEDNEGTIFVDGAKKFDALFKDILEAKQSIHLLYYIVRPGDLARKMVTLLTEKAKEGVEVKFLYDDIGSLTIRPQFFRALTAAGGSVKAFFPRILGINLAINYRNHRKIVVIDGKTAYLGGMNLADEYIHGIGRLRPWRDTHLRITGSAVALLQMRFLMDWEATTGNQSSPEQIDRYFDLPETPSDSGKLGMQIVSSGPDNLRDDEIRDAFIQMIILARRRVIIQTPYFIPDPAFTAALKIAAQSGVQVELMLPGVPDHQVVYLASHSFLRDLLEEGVQVYHYRGFLHAKMVVIDAAVASIGTTNIDNRSFALNFEINAFIYNREFAARCEAIFETDLEQSYSLDRDWFASRSLWWNGASAVTRLLAPLL